MKTSKIEKHMMRRTVVVARDGVVKGVINNADGSAAPVLIAGVSRLSALHGGLYNGWFPPEEIRKATDAERAEFFAWLVSDGRDITDNFVRFGGMPRGFEAWRAAQTPADEPTPEPAVTPQHKVGDLRVWLRSNGIGAVARITASKDGVVAFAEYKAYDADAVFEPTRASMARLVEQQRARGVEPELGDLVFVLTEVVSTAVVAHNTPSAPAPLRLLGAMCGGGAISWGLAPDIAAHTLVIRRCPFREVDHG